MKTERRMPAEWEPHDACWMGWPGTDSVFSDDLPRGRAAYAAVAKAISRFEPVFMLTNAEDIGNATEMCGPDVKVVEGRTNDVWLRDTGATIVQDQAELLAIDWTFNAYGRKYEPYDLDKSIAAQMADSIGIERSISPLVCEGGAIHVDGDGTVLTTEDVMLNVNRNPDMSKTDVERELCHQLGGKKVIWLKHGLVEDNDTDGHVDTVAAFVAPGKVVIQVASSADHPNHERLAINRDILTSETDAQGRAFELFEIEAPRSCHDPKRGGLPLSYINFYIANGGIVAPQFDDPGDEQALEVLRHCFPDRDVVGVSATDIFRGGGGIHCITQQQPSRPA